MNIMVPIISFEQKLIQLAGQKYELLLDLKGVVMDIWGCAIKREHQGRRLLRKMILANEYLGIMSGYQYSFSYTTNIKSSEHFRKLSYDNLSRSDARDFEIDGVKYFSMVEE